MEILDEFPFNTETFKTAFNEYIEFLVDQGYNISTNGENHILARIRKFYSSESEAIDYLIFNRKLIQTGRLKLADLTGFI
jgi:hypothetical protein